MTISCQKLIISLFLTMQYLECDKPLGRGRRKLLRLLLSVTFCSLFLSSKFQYSRERSSACQRKCQRPASVPQGAWTEFLPQQRHKMLDMEHQKLHSFVADRHRGSVRTQRKRTGRFLFNASCLIFFYYYVQRFFYIKKLNAVLINSVCSFNWGSSKSEVFVRNKCKLFF